MMTAPYVEADPYGVMRVGSSKVMLDSVLAAFAQGHSPETIRSQYPELTFGEVYGAITHYLSHRDEVDVYLQRQDGVWARAEEKSRATPAPVIERLRKLGLAAE